MEIDQKLSRTAAALCSAAIHEMVPGSDLLGGGETDTGFFYQFFYPKIFSTDLAKMIEERMRQIAKEDRPIRAMEMVSFSAKEMFHMAGHMAACDALEDMEPKELVSVVKIGAFVDLAEGTFCDSLADVGAFQVTGLKSLGDGEYRIEGCVASSKDELKAFLKKLRKYAEENHLAVGTRLALWECVDGGIVWLSRGLDFRRGMIELFKQDIGLGVPEIQAHPRLLEQYAAKQKGTWAYWTIVQVGKDPEGDGALFEDCCQTVLQQKIYCKETEMRDSAFSLLQSIHKTLIILGFHPELRLCGRRTDEKGLKLLEQGFVGLGVKPRFEPSEKAGSRAQWLVSDGLGQMRIAAELEVEAALSVKLNVERILGLLLELTQGNIPGLTNAQNR